MTDSSDLYLLDEKTATRVAELFRAFSDPTRVRIVSALISRELNVGALAQTLSISESAISHQLRILRQMRLVESRRQGKEVYYRMSDEHIITLFQQGVDHIHEA